ncbi:MAG TPA: hypothetical protein VKV26_05110 [Dehalococcoidia bacterium]|nr:hypothetical protein [Dehalococcoidia bacterium]
MAAWDFPVLILQGFHDPRQPHEFYEGVEPFVPRARLSCIDAVHFFVFENPDVTTRTLAAFLGTK